MRVKQRGSKWNYVNYYEYGDNEVEVGKFQIHHNPASKEYALWGVEVYEPYRGLGHGRELMQHATLLLKEFGATRVSLFVDTKNVVAIKLYESLGWKKATEWERGVIRMEVEIK